MAIRGQNSKKMDRQLALSIMISFVILGAIYALIVLPYFSNSPWFYNLNPVEAYILWNIGNVFLIGGILGGTFGLVSGKFDFFGFLKSGLSGFILFSWVFDMWQPPLAWSTSGQLLVPLNGSLENTAVDYMFGWLYMQIGIMGFPLFVMVYGITPIIGVILAFFILSPRRFVHEAGVRG